MRSIRQDTRAAIVALHAEMTYGELAAHLGLESSISATLSRIARGVSVSAPMENKVRVALGLAPSHRKRYWRPCLPATLTDDQKARIWKIANE